MSHYTYNYPLYIYLYAHPVVLFLPLPFLHPSPPTNEAVGLDKVPDSPLPEQLTIQHSPKQHYLVFPSPVGPIPDVVMQAWAGVWEYFKRDDIPYTRTYNCDIESYEGVTDPTNAQINIYIGIEPPQ